MEALSALFAGLIAWVMSVVGFSFVDIIKQVPPSSQSTSSATVSSDINGVEQHQYINSKYRFTLTFPNSWKEYRIKEDENGVLVGIKDQDKVFSIRAHTKQEWEKMEYYASQDPNSQNFEPNFGLKIGENATYVFAYYHAQDYTDAVRPLLEEREAIIASFRVQ